MLIVISIDFLVKFFRSGSGFCCKLVYIALMGVAVVLQFCGFVFWAATSGAGFSDDCDGENYLQVEESDGATI
jgi:hypothetical protein